MKTIIAICVVLMLGMNPPSAAAADEVTDWNRNMFEAALLANTSPIVATRVSAIVHGSIYDALNGIERRFTPLHVEPAAAPGASRRAAVVQAAYASLVRLYPSQVATFNQIRIESLNAIASEEAVEHSKSIARGIEWGQHVADEIWAWRSTDGFNTTPAPFTGGTNPGEWRPAVAGASMAGLQFVNMTPWVIESPSQFFPPGPPALTNDQYTADFNETKSMGSETSPSRTTDQTLYSLFWNAGTASYLWNTVALSIGSERHTTLSENSRLFALVNISMADALIGCWNAKKAYSFWRPFSAIPLAATDSNPGTSDDANWKALIPTTPNHPEYPSGHSCVSGAAGAVLSSYFGEQSSFVVTSDVMLGVSRFFPSFTAATDEVKNARIFGGIHFRDACDDGQDLGVGVANYVLDNAFLPLHGKKKGQ